MEDLLGMVRNKLLNSGKVISTKEIASTIRTATHDLLSEEQFLTELHKIEGEIIGLGKLEKLLSIPDVSDVLVVGTKGIWIDKGNGLEKCKIHFSNDNEVELLATRLALQNGKRLDIARPWVDTNIKLPSIKNAIRLHAVLGTVSRQGTCISLRILRPKEVTLDELCSRGVFSVEIKQYLKEIIISKESFLIAGGTGSGKTTLLGALLREISENERIICIEDTFELLPNSISQINLTTMEANNDNKGEITLSTLIKQSLRMRPDRIVVGEVRGKEIIDLLTALNTGHRGSAGTIHANSVTEVPSRVEALGTLAGIDRVAVHSLFISAVKIILFMRKNEQGIRELSEIGVIKSDTNGLARVKIIWQSSESNNFLQDYKDA